jgi:outer membrane protein OmpU
MKKVLFATTATAVLATGGMASAQGITLFGDARLGLGWNIFNDGDVRLNDDGDAVDELFAVSRVRFGVNMTGTTDSGITFGATIRADNAIGGAGDRVDPGPDDLGQTEGEVFVSGQWGTLTLGDTSGADEYHVGDLNEVGLTCLGCQNETLFISNGGGFGDDDNNFASNPEARPTIRWDYNFAGFGFSLSSNRDLTDVGVGAGWTGEFGGGSITAGLGYYNFEDFTIFNPETVTVAVVDPNTGLPIPGETVEVEGDDVSTTVNGGEQWSAQLGGDFAAFNGKLIYTRASAEDADFDTAGIGLGTVFGLWSLDAYYTQIVKAEGGTGDILDEADGLQSYGVGVTYDLGGGARIEGGVGSVWDLGAADDGFLVADFGIGMAF